MRGLCSAQCRPIAIHSFSHILSSRRAQVILVEEKKVMRLLPRLFYVAIPLFWSLLPYVISEDHLLPFKLCGPDELGVEVIRLNAWPLVPGRELTITAIYTPNVTVTGGEALVTGAFKEAR